MPFIKLHANILLREEVRAFPSFENYLNAKTNTLLCLIGSPRPNKVALYHCISKSGLDNSSICSFHGFADKKGQGLKAYSLDMIKSTFLRELFRPILSDIDLINAVESLPVRLQDALTDVDFNSLVMKMPTELYEKTFFSLVPETDFHQSYAMQRITEKTFKGYAMDHPIIILGNPFSLRIARELGFETFDDIIDCNYDSVVEPLARFEAVLQTLERVVFSLQNEPRTFAHSIYERGKITMSLLVA